MTLAPLTGGVLVGGASSRMGRPKSLLRVGERTFVEHVVNVLRRRCPRVCLLGAWPPQLATDARVVADARNADAASDAEQTEDVDVDVALAGTECIRDAPGIRGPLAGVLGALRAAPHSAWLIAAVDLPLLRVAALDWLLAQRDPDAIAIIPRMTPEFVEPLLAVYERAALAAVEPLARDAARGLQPLAKHARVLTPTPPPDLAPCWTNINTPAEYQAMRDSIRPR
ncbi:MAG: molybdenum cofactor guanylyltransferase [Phycisphaerae bacterium]